jgi:hypothetical protein
LVELHAVGNLSCGSRSKGACPSLHQADQSAAVHVGDHFYRIYSLSVTNAITGAVNRLFRDDAEALSHAGRYLSIHPAVEIWRTDRLIGRLEREQAIRGHDAAAARD